MKERSLPTFDDIPVRYAVAECAKHKPWIVLVMPFGLRLALAQPFFSFFGSHYRILTWESRAILSLPNDETHEFSVEKHVRDMYALLAHCSVERAVLLGYCSGAGIALAAASQSSHLFSSLILAHGEYALFDDPSCVTPFAREIDTLLTLATRSEEKLQLVFDKINERRDHELANVPRGMETPYTKLGYLRRYAANYLAYKAVNYQELAKSLTHKTLLLTGGRDIQANVKSTQKIHGLIANSEVHIEPQADHYGLVREESSTMDAIWNYCGRHGFR